MTPETFADVESDSFASFLGLGIKYPAESPDHDFTKGDKCDVRLLRGAGGRFSRGRIRQEEGGTRI